MRGVGEEEEEEEIEEEEGEGEWVLGHILTTRSKAGKERLT